MFNPVITETDCPFTHPIPFWKGTACCSSDFDCHGEEIKPESICCQDNDFILCPNSVCRQKSKKFNTSIIFCLPDIHIHFSLWLPIIKHTTSIN